MILLWNSSEMTVSLTLIDGDEQWAYAWKAERNLARDMLGYLRDRLAERMLREMQDGLVHRILLRLHPLFHIFQVGIQAVRS